MRVDASLQTDTLYSKTHTGTPHHQRLRNDATQRPMVSVVMPVYNLEQYVGEALSSILQQTYTNMEVIVINDASVDNTLKVIESFEDSRIRIVSNPVNLGLVKTLNKGLDLATGDFIARMDGDDVAHPERLEKQINYLQQHPEVDVVGTWAYVFGNKADFLQPSLHHEEIKAQLLFLNRLIHPTLLFRRKTLEQHGIRFDEHYVKCEDYALWVEVIDKLRFANLPEVLLSYRLHDDNYSVPQQRNGNLIQYWNTVNYITMLRRVGVAFSDEELTLHHSVSFFSSEPIAEITFQAYIQWFRKIVAANNVSRYFDKQSLANEIIERIILLNKMAAQPIGLLRLITRYLVPIFSLKTFLAYLPFKWRKTSHHNNNLALVRRIGNKPLSTT